MSKTLRRLAIFILICMVCGIIIPFTFESEKAEPDDTKTIEYNESSFAPYSERNGWGFAEYKNKFDSLFDYFADKEYIITVKAVDWDMEVISTELSSASIHKAYEKVLYEVTEIDGYTFDGWYDETGKVSDDLSYEHTVRGDKLLTARYIKDPVVSTMYSTTRLNVRTGPDVEYDIITTVPVNYEFTVYDHDDENVWDMVEYEGARYYVATEFLKEEKTVYATSCYVSETSKRVWPVSTHFCYYGIYSGEYWNFTPEQIDNAWSGKKKDKPILPAGTTRAWQKYLWDKLAERGIEWWYSIAVAQAMQESSMNPLNNVNRTIITWLNGEATYDCGLFSFKTKFWTGAYGDVCDYRANINAYVDRVYKYVCNCKSAYDIEMALSQHYCGTYRHQEKYCSDVYTHIAELWEMN